MIDADMHIQAGDNSLTIQANKIIFDLASDGSGELSISEVDQMILVIDALRRSSNYKEAEFLCEWMLDNGFLFHPKNRATATIFSQFLIQIATIKIDLEKISNSNRSAISLLRKSIELSKEYSIFETFLLAHHMSSVGYAMHGCNKRAFFLCERISREMPNNKFFTKSQAHIFRDMGIYLTRLGHCDQAEMYLRKSIKLYSNTDSITDIAISEQKLSNTLCLLGRADEAWKHLNSSTSILQDQDALSKAKDMVANYLFTLRFDSKKSLELFNKSRDFCHKNGFYYQVKSLEQARSAFSCG